LDAAGIRWRRRASGPLPHTKYQLKDHDKKSIPIFNASSTLLPDKVMWMESKAFRLGPGGTQQIFPIFEFHSHFLAQILFISAAAPETLPVRSQKPALRVGFQGGGA